MATVRSPTTDNPSQGLVPTVVQHKYHGDHAGSLRKWIFLNVPCLSLRLFFLSTVKDFFRININITFNQFLQKSSQLVSSLK